MFEAGRVQRDFSRAAAYYDAHAGLQQRVLATLTGMAKLPPGSRVLDAGCGTGRLAATLKGYNIVQIDIAPMMCRTALAHAPAVNGSVEQLPFADAAFDAVFSSLVLQWVPGWQPAIEEMRRVLKPGGLLALSSFGPATLCELKESFAQVDDHSHISDFLPRFDEVKSEMIIEYYPNAIALMRQLKAIGAQNKLAQGRKSLMTRRQMDRLENYYASRFGASEGLPATWEIFYSVTRKQ